MQKICKCPQCDTTMEFKGKLDDSGQSSTIFYQCPKCKNVQLYARQYESQFRIDYP